MGHPATNWVKSELAREWGSENPEFTVEFANIQLAEMGLPRIDDNGFEIIRMRFSPPEGFSYTSGSNRTTSSRASISFLKEEKIYSLVKPVNGTLRMLNEFVAGSKIQLRTLQILLLGDVSNAAIAKRLDGRFNNGEHAYTERMVAAYRHYFWNVPACTHMEWERYLLESKGAGDSGNFVSALYAGPEQALYRAGFSPKISGDTLLKEAQRQIYYNMQALRFSPVDSKTVSMISTLTGRAIAVDEALKSGGASLQEILDKFRAIIVKRDKNDMISISDLVNQLEGGSFSEDGSDDKDKKETEDGND